jgi:cation diffusion facilitator CzcD-associated flavoprotein CzcO
MVYDKNYFLDQLRNGARIEDIGQALADAMNEAQEAHIAEQVAAAKAAEEAQNKAAIEATKREMAMDMIDIIRDYGLMVAPETADVMNEIDDEDIDMMVHTLDEMFHMLAALANLKHTMAKAPVGNSKPSDDAILANFIASLT